MLGLTADERTIVANRRLRLLGAEAVTVVRTAMSMSCAKLTLQSWLLS